VGSRDLASRGEMGPLLTRLAVTAGGSGSASEKGPPRF
jgi:hypothetical protein